MDRTKVLYGFIHRNDQQGIKSGEAHLIRVRLSLPCPKP